jgi:hypothetical protein
LLIVIGLSLLSIRISKIDGDILIEVVLPNLLKVIVFFHLFYHGYWVYLVTAQIILNACLFLESQELSYQLPKKALHIC